MTRKYTMVVIDLRNGESHVHLIQSTDIASAMRRGFLMSASQLQNDDPTLTGDVSVMLGGVTIKRGDRVKELQELLTSDIDAHEALNTVIHSVEGTRH